MSTSYSVQDIANLSGGILVHSATKDQSVETLIIDSRKISNPTKGIFIAIVGERNNGHQFIQDAYNKGIRAFMISDEIDTNIYPDAAFIKVQNCLLAVQELARKHRLSYSFPVIGITGSSGKTIIKEWLYQLLKEEYHIVKSPKSYNSQIGVPLSVWNTSDEHNFGIFEAGISQPNEMKSLAHIIQPTVGIFTNIGTAHDENFSSWEQKAKEKLLLFKEAEQLIYCRDYTVLHDVITANKSAKTNTFIWSKKMRADLMVGKIEKQENATKIQAVFQNSFINIEIPFKDEGSIENCINCWCLLLMLGYENEWIQEKMKSLVPIAMRLEMKEGLNDCSIINDYYNSDLGGLEIAIDFMLQQKQHAKNTIILSDILQSGKSDEDLYSAVATLCKDKEINQIIGIGEQIGLQKDRFPKSALFFKTTDEFIDQIDLSIFKNQTILLKGARVFGFEKISNLFQKRAHETVLEINLSAVIHNLNYFKSKLKSDTKIMAMVKAFSYGSGSYEIANMLQFNLVDYLAVAYVDEGVELRKAGISLPIMVMNPEQYGYDLMIQYNLEPEIYSFKVLDLFIKALKRNGWDKPKGYPVHIKLDTGMHRLGFEASDINKLTIRLKNHKIIEVKSAFSHLATAEELHQKAFTLQQINTFNNLSAILEKGLQKTITKHICNSAGAINYPEAQNDLVRLGIGLYGIAPNPNHQKNLEVVSELKTTISQIKFVKAHESVGYSRMEMPTKDIVIATVPIGYADGLRRSLGRRKGFMWIHGKKAPIVGNVCMDMCMLDITNIDAKEGDEVIVFGKDYPIQEFAKAMDTIPYEALTNISPRVKRVYYQE